MTDALPGAAPQDVQALAEGLRPAILRLGRQLRRQAQSLGLSPLDATLLGAIKTREGLGVSDLAELEQTSRPTMSAHVKRLEADGYLRRLPGDDADRRRVRLGLTPAGRKALDAVRSRRNDWLARRLAALAPADRAALEAALAALAEIAGERP